jgi:hypothetical protein
LQLTTDQGRVLDVRFSSRRSAIEPEAVHAEVGGDLPPASQWRR